MFGMTRRNQRIQRNQAIAVKAAWCLHPNGEIDSNATHSDGDSCGALWAAAGSMDIDQAVALWDDYKRRKASTRLGK